MRKVILTFLLLAPIAWSCSRGVDTGKTIDRATADRPAAAPAPDQGAPGSDSGTPTRGTVAPGSPATGTATPSPAAPGRPAPADEISGAGAAPAFRELRVPAGTELHIRLEDSVASDTSRAEQAVRAELAQPVVVHGTTALPGGSTVSGTVTSARRSGRVKGRAELGIRFDTIEPKDASAPYKMRTGIVTRKAAGTGKKDALTIVGPAAGGALLGGIFGGKKGALIGTTVGGGAGTAVVLSTRGKEVRLPRGTQLVIKLMEPLTVRVRA